MKAILTLFPTLLFLVAPPEISWVTSELTRKDWYVMSAYYPQFRGNGVARLASQGVREAANTRLSSFQKNASMSSSRPQRPWSVKWKGTVSAATDRYVSVLATCEYDTGGVRPNRDAIRLNYAIKAGVARKINLADLMVVRADPTGFASDLLLPKLTVMGVSGVASGTVTRLTTAQADNFVMTPAGIAWIFNPGEIGSYEEGTIIAKFTWMELEGRVTKDL